MRSASPPFALRDNLHPLWVKEFHLPFTVGEFCQADSDHDFVSEVNGAIGFLGAVADALKEVFVVCSQDVRYPFRRHSHRFHFIGVDALGLDDNVIATQQHVGFVPVHDGFQAPLVRR